MNFTFSGYTTTFNCLKKHYPLELCIKSLLGFCDQVCVVDSGSNDGTIELLESWQKKESRINFLINPVDFSHPRWAIYMDGYQKAKARSLCTTDYCWQTDTDEVVVEKDFERIKQLPKLLAPLFEVYPIIYLPMVEFWGSFDRIRADFFTWKQRISKNDPNITHGIPKDLACYDDSGHEYPRPFDSDSCNYIFKSDKTSVPSVVPLKVNNFNMDPQEFLAFFDYALDMLPSVLHVSWLNLKRKIEHYREFWPKFHQSMYNLSKLDAPENNVMFDKPWSQVNDEDILLKAKELKELGPRSFHHKINPNQKGATVSFKRPIPADLENWAKATENLA